MHFHIQRVKTFLYCTAPLLFLASALPVRAEVLFFDNFDDGDLNGWTVTRNMQWMNSTQPCLDNGQIAYWQILLQKLGIEISGPGCFTEIVASTLQIEDNKSYAYSFDMTMPESASMDRGYTVRYADISQNYAFKTLGQSIFLEKMVNGRGWSVPGAWASYPFMADTTYHFRNELTTDNRMKVYINDQLVLDFLDPEPHFTGGTVGFRASVGAISHSVSWFDNAKVETLGDVSLNVPYVSQRDTRWKAQVYDRANVWSSLKATIEDWGCALADAVMVLKYYGITALPNGGELDPGTLNTWLTAQKDGYIGQGYLNWIALTRLTKLFSISHPEIPALEYRRLGNDLPALQTELAQSRPTILELPGHFVTARGYTDYTNAVTIHDPYFQEKLSLADYGNQFLSMRTFTPSHTDLSYILVVSDPDVSLDLQKEGVEVESFSELPLSRPETGEQPQQSVNVHQIAKPPEGDYLLSASKHSPGTSTVQIYAYTTDGEVEIFEQSIDSRARLQTFTLHYAPSGSSTIEPGNPIASLSSLIQQLRATKDITRAFPYDVLFTTAEYLQDAQADQPSYRRYLTLMHKKNELFTPFFTPKAQQELSDYLSYLEEM